METMGSKITLVGRTNVGKSSLFNCLTRSRMAVVGKQERLTRDRKHGVWKFENGESQHVLTDTGGIVSVSDETILDELSKRQTLRALRETDLVFFVVDAKEIWQDDWVVADLVRLSGKPTLLVVNKCDNPMIEVDAIQLFSVFGFADVMAVSVAGNKNLSLLEDWVLKQKVSVDNVADNMSNNVVVSILGKPNVGKSSLFNILVNDERSVVSDIAGTTRDVVESIGTIFNVSYTFADTAGMRRRMRIDEPVEKLCVSKGIKHLDFTDLVVLLVDVSEGLSRQDKILLSLCRRRKKSVLIVLNKWDLRSQDMTKKDYVTDLKIGLRGQHDFSVFFVSCQDGFGIRSLRMGIAALAKKYAMRISTSKLNRWIQTLQNSGKCKTVFRKLKILYATQVGGMPPEFLFFVNKKFLWHDDCEKFLSKQLKFEFQLHGVSIRIFVRNADCGGFSSEDGNFVSKRRVMHKAR